MAATIGTSNANYTLTTTYSTGTNAVATAALAQVNASAATITNPWNMAGTLGLTFYPPYNTNSLIGTNGNTGIGNGTWTYTGGLYQDQADVNLQMVNATTFWQINASGQGVATNSSVLPIGHFQTTTIPYSSKLIVLDVAYLGLNYQSTNANLTAWQAYSTNAYTSTNVFQTGTNAIYLASQPASSTLTNLATLPNGTAALIVTNTAPTNAAIPSISFGTLLVPTNSASGGGNATNAILINNGVGTNTSIYGTLIASNILSAPQGSQGTTNPVIIAPISTYGNAAGIAVQSPSFYNGGQNIALIASKSSTVAWLESAIIAADGSTLLFPANDSAIIAAFLSTNLGSDSLLVGRYADLTQNHSFLFSDGANFDLYATRNNTYTNNSAAFFVQNGFSINTNFAAGNALKVNGNVDASGFSINGTSLGSSSGTVTAQSNLVIGAMATLTNGGTNFIGTFGATSELNSDAGWRLSAANTWTNEYFPIWSLVYSTPNLVKQSNSVTYDTIPMATLLAATNPVQMTVIGIAGTVHRLLLFISEQSRLGTVLKSMATLGFRPMTRRLSMRRTISTRQF